MKSDNALFLLVGAACLLTNLAIVVHTKVDFSVRMKTHIAEAPAPVTTPKQYIETARGASRAYAMENSLENR